MVVKIQPSILKGEIIAPASKSSMQRACAAALVHKGISIISNPGTSNDDKAALGIIKEMGCEWRIENGQLIIDSTNAIIHTHNSQFTNHTINCGESGLSIRMFSPIVSLSGELITVTGSGSLATRPMDFFDEILPQLGVEIKSNEGKLPLQLKGPLQQKDITIDGSLSSQFLTGLLMAYSALAGNVTITVNNLKSKPYIGLTLKVMKDFGLNVPVNNNYETFEFIKNTNTRPSTINYTVEGDWSGAAFLLVAGAIAGEIIVKGLDIYSTQADKAILNAIADSGAKLSIEENQITVGSISGFSGKAFHFNATDCPDLFPPLVALASYCDGITTIEGVNRLAHKESNRGLTLQEEFAKMGVAIELQGDLMLVKGTQKINAATTYSHHDHRIAMACAVVGLKADGEMVIEDAEAINKSYPDFYEHIKLLGATVIVNEPVLKD